MTPVALSRLRERIISAPETTERAAMTKTADPAIAQRIAEAKEVLLGNGEAGPAFDLATAHLRGVPGSENTIQKMMQLKALHESPHFMKDDDSEAITRIQDIEHSIDELGTSHGHPPLPNPNTGKTLQQHDLENHGTLTPNLDKVVDSYKGDPDLGPRLTNFRDEVAKHLQDTGHSETGLLSKYFIEGANTKHPLFDMPSWHEDLFDPITESLEGNF